MSDLMHHAKPRADVRVAIVDDHEVLAASLDHVLSREPGIECVGWGGTIEEAKSIVREQRPDVLLLDHALPDGAGVYYLDELLRLHPGLRVIVLTGAPTENLVSAAIERGAAGFLSKSRSLAEVTAAIRSAAEGDAVVSPDLLGRLLEGLRRGSSPTPQRRLTDREQEVLELLAEGLTNRAIAERLTVSVGTVRNHVSNLSVKLDAHSKLEALVIAYREGLLQEP